MAYPSTGHVRILRRVMSKSQDGEACLTCYGSGEVPGDGVPQTCPDCYGEGSSLSRGTRLEWRLRAIERAYASAASETQSDVTWLIHELRASRQALLLILARCQDADENDATARDVKFQANDALGIYEPR
jgi:hypothetical protein